MDELHANAASFFANFFGSNHDHVLVRFGVCIDGVALMPTYHGLIDFHLSLEAVTSRTDHARTELLQHQPGAPITAQSQSSLQPQSTDPLFLVCDPPGSPKPHHQRQMAPVKYSPSRRRDLVATANARETLSRLPPVLFAAAPLAHPPRTEAQLK